MKNKKILITIWFSTIIITLLGATFSYYATRTASNNEAVQTQAGKFGAELYISAKFIDEPLIPVNEKDLQLAYQNECIDEKGFGACQAYEITIKNIGTELKYMGEISFELDNLLNLKYIVLDEDGNIYQESTNIIPEEELPLGEEFLLANEEVKKFTLIIWLPNYDYDQNSDDAEGKFTANMIYYSKNNTKITGTISSSWE